jgi:hypothetical protein
LRFEGKPPELPAALRGVIQCIPRAGQLRLTLVNVTAETRALLAGMEPTSIEEVPISLEDAFVSYLGGNLETVRLPEIQERVELAGGVP